MLVYQDNRIAESRALPDDSVITELNNRKIQ